MNSLRPPPFILYCHDDVAVEIVEPSAFPDWTPNMTHPFRVFHIITRDEGAVWRQYADGNGFRTKLVELLCPEDRRTELVRYFFKRDLDPGDAFMQLLIYMPGPQRVRHQEIQQATVWGELVIGHKDNFDRYGRLK